jgi:Uma2 family endonuclease
MKQSDYAQASIPEYWILNLRDNQLEVYRDPDTAQGVYRSRTVHAPGETVSPLGAPQANIAVNDLLGI